MLTTNEIEVIWAPSGQDRAKTCAVAKQAGCHVRADAVRLSLFAIFDGRYLRDAPGAGVHFRCDGRHGAGL